jgi:hypothetical protein
MMVQQRVFLSSGDRSFVFTASDAAKDYLLEAGTDIKYGARHLKRAIERLLVQPMSNLIATGQVCGGDWIRVDYDVSEGRMTFFKEAEGLPTRTMSELVDTSLPNMAVALGQPAPPEPQRVTLARTSRRS